jgi:hypothetical protein
MRGAGGGRDICKDNSFPPLPKGNKLLKAFLIGLKITFGDHDHSG